jgi:hypothetical protein
MTRLLCVLALVLAGCGAPPRSPAYFAAHPDETARVLAGCGHDSHRGPECSNARDGQAVLERKARMDLYRKGFE